MNALRRSAVLARDVTRGAIDLLFPPLCTACDDRLPAGETVLPLCAPCRRTLPHAPQDAIDERLARLGDDAGILGHRAALWTFDDGGVMQSLQHALKYRDRPSLGVRLGQEIGRLWQAKRFPHPDLVVPVPLARLRFLERGYNQAERLAAGAAAALERPLEELIMRARPTKSQTRLSREARRANVAGAFRLADDYDLTDLRVLLIDDVVTTGATVVAAAEPIRAAGAIVDLAALALARE